MTFSIIIPVFKTEPFLARCLDSFAAQTDSDFEVIVVDDASPSEESKAKNGATCSEIVAKYDKRFRYTRHERNLSLFQARQTGLRMAQGEYVIPFDSDDYAMPELLVRLKKVVVESRRCRADGLDSVDVLVYQMMYDDGKKITKPSVRYRDETLTGGEALDRFFASRIQCAICGKAVRREVYLKAMDQLAAPRDFYLNSSEDLCQTFPVLANAQSVATLSYPGYRYWLNGDSLTTTLTAPAKLGKAAENTARVFSLLKDFARREEARRQRSEVEQWCEKLDHFMRPTLRWYLSNLRSLPEREWRACVAELNRYFAPDLVAREAMMLLEESNTYRLGRLLTAPLRLLRRSR